MVLIEVELEVEIKVDKRVAVSLVVVKAVRVVVGVVLILMLIMINSRQNGRAGSPHRPPAGMVAESVGQVGGGALKNQNKEAILRTGNQKRFGQGRSQIEQSSV